MGLVIVLVLLQLVIGLVGAWREAHKGWKAALTPALVLPALAILWFVILAIGDGGVSEGIARTFPILAALMLILLFVGLVPAAILYRFRR
jgi:SNF family Na+-dependent transporter